MKVGDAQILLMDLMVGATVLSMRVAGPELELIFTGGNPNISSSFSIDTDAWISVGEGVSVEKCEVKEDGFFAQRVAVIPKLYELTGCDVESVSVSKDGSLALVIDGISVLIVPRDSGISSSAERDSWNVILYDENDDRHGYVGFFVGQGLHRQPF